MDYILFINNLYVIYIITIFKFGCFFSVGKSILHSRVYILKM